MSNYLKLFTTHSEYQTYAQSGDMIKPNVSYCEDNNEVHYNPFSYADEYLTFMALEDGTFQFSNNAISYSLDNGETWTSLGANTASPTVTAGNKIMWKGELTPSLGYGIGTFSATGNFNVQGNPMSLLFGDNFKGQTDLTGKNYAFYNLFKNNTKVVSAENLSLSATTLANTCYSSMFEGCTSLVNAPELPATTLANTCYSYMFRNCTSLVTAPELPATTLASSCYQFMFRNCTSLTTAPQLPATTLTSGCYNSMFSGCSNLNHIKAMFTTTPGTSYTQNWVNDVAATGTFVKNSASEWDVSGVNGVPSGWTIETASE